MSKPLPRSAPGRMGVDPAAITRFIDAIVSDKLELHSFMMLRHGSVVAEGWWKPYAPERPHMLFSLSKSFTSTAVGFAVAEGLLSVDDPVLKFFPGEAPAKPGRHWEDMKVKHLLTMTTGHAADTLRFLFSRKDGDWVKGFLSRPLRYRPGTHFLYNTGATYMLSVIVQRLTGQRVLDYLAPRLFEPLGVEGAAWQQCPRGYDTGGFGLSVKTEDIAKFGQFLLQRGMWEGKQLLPAAWVDEATRKQVENGKADGTTDWGEGYGYQFWRCVADCYRGDGAFGQYCVVIPRLDAVVAMTGGLGDMGAVLKRLWELLPAVGEPITEDPKAEQAMRERLAALKYDPPALISRSPLEAGLNGKTFRMERNRERLTKLTLRFAGDRCEADVRWGRRGTTLVCGREHWLECGHEPPAAHTAMPQAAATAAAYTWEDGNTLLVTSRDVNAPFVTTLRLAFTADSVELKTSMNVSFGPTDQPPVKGKPV